MLEAKKRRKRLLQNWSLIVVLILGGILLSAMNLELSGALFMLVAGVLSIYMLLSNRKILKNIFAKLPLHINTESWAAAIILMSLLFFVILEALPERLPEALVFFMLTMCILVYALRKFNPANRNVLVVLFFLGTGAALIKMNDRFEESELFLIATLLYCLFFSGVVLRWFFNQIKTILQMRNERTQAELKHLQSQVNPHFFFNMLNNLYGLVAQDTKKSQDLILKLSDMMRYSIYDGQEQVVQISAEINYLKNFIELHRMRYHKKIEVSFEQEVENENQEVMPLLFINLLENAFKHGVETLRADAFVNVFLKAIDNRIDFSVENNFDQEEPGKEEGIGLKNLKRRLELVYPQRHTLHCTKSNGVYRANLTLEL